MEEQLGGCFQVFALNTIIKIQSAKKQKYNFTFFLKQETNKLCILLSTIKCYGQQSALPTEVRFL